MRTMYSHHPKMTRQNVRLLILGIVIFQGLLMLSWVQRNLTDFPPLREDPASYEFQGLATFRQLELQGIGPYLADTFSGQNVDGPLYGILQAGLYLFFGTHWYTPYLLNLGVMLGLYSAVYCLAELLRPRAGLFSVLLIAGLSSSLKWGFLYFQPFPLIAALSTIAMLALIRSRGFLDWRWSAVFVLSLTSAFWIKNAMYLYFVPHVLVFAYLVLTIGRKYRKARPMLTGGLLVGCLIVLLSVWPVAFNWQTIYSYYSSFIATNPISDYYRLGPEWLFYLRNLTDYHAGPLWLAIWVCILLGALVRWLIHLRRANASAKSHKSLHAIPILLLWCSGYIPLSLIATRSPFADWPLLPAPILLLGVAASAALDRVSFRSLSGYRMAAAAVGIIATGVNLSAALEPERAIYVAHDWAFEAAVQAIREDASARGLGPTISIFPGTIDEVYNLFSVGDGLMRRYSYVVKYAGGETSAYRFRNQQEIQDQIGSANYVIVKTSELGPPFVPLVQQMQPLAGEIASNEYPYLQSIWVSPRLPDGSNAIIYRNARNVVLQGLYEDGWLGVEGFARLTFPLEARRLVLSGMVPQEFESALPFEFSIVTTDGVDLATASVNGIGQQRLVFDFPAEFMSQHDAVDIRLRANHGASFNGADTRALTLYHPVLNWEP